MLDILFISIIIVFCIDLSGAMDKLNRLVWNKLYPGMKYNDWSIPLFGCSLCSTFWASILYLIITGTFSLGMLAYVSIVALLTTVIKDALVLIKELLQKIIDIIFNFIN